MLTMITLPRYPSSSRAAEPQEPMLVLARTIVNVFPLHSHSPSTSPTTSTFETEEKAPLLATSVKKATTAVQKYGSMLKSHYRSESRKAQLKVCISRPISEDSQWCTRVEEEEAKQVDREMEQSVGSVYSTATWSAAAERVSSSDDGPFEYDQRLSSEDRSSVQTFASSERSYTFF